MLPENLNIELKRAPSGRWTATVAREQGEGRSQTEALRALADRLDRREAARLRFGEALEAIQAEAARQGTDTLTEEEIQAEIDAHRRGE